MNEKASCITINCGCCGGNGEDTFPFEALYKINGVVGALNDAPIPYPDLCNSENFLPISLMIRAQDGVGVFQLCTRQCLYTDYEGRVCNSC